MLLPGRHLLSAICHAIRAITSSVVDAARASQSMRAEESLHDNQLVKFKCLVASTDKFLMVESGEPGTSAFVCMYQEDEASVFVVGQTLSIMQAH